MLMCQYLSLSAASQLVGHAWSIPLCALKFLLPICIEIFLFFDSSSHPCVVKPTSLITYIRYECSKNVSLRTHIRYSVGKLTSLMITHIRDARWLQPFYGDPCQTSPYVMTVIIDGRNYISDVVRQAKSSSVMKLTNILDYRIQLSDRQLQASRNHIVCLACFLVEIRENYH